jgi:hypothetical protein
MSTPTIPGTLAATRSGDTLLRAVDASGRIVANTKTQERHTVAEWDRRDSETHGVIRSDAGTIVGLSRLVRASRDA